MSLRIILGLAIVCGARRAIAERAVQVAVAPTVPFDEAELSAALRLRLPDGEPIAIAVAPVDGGVRITVGAEVRVVALDGLRGAEAARLVALATADLFDADLAHAPDPALAPPAMTPAIGVRSRGAPAAPGPRGTVEVLGTAAAWDQVLAGGAIGIAVPRGGWIATVAIGGGGLVNAPIGLVGGAIRMGGGRRLDWIDLRAEVVIAPIAVSSGAGDRTALVGVGASARLRVPVTRRVRGVVGIGLDGFANRTSYQASGVMLARTPWLAPWLVAGIEVSP